MRSGGRHVVPLDALESPPGHPGSGLVRLHLDVVSRPVARCVQELITRRCLRALQAVRLGTIGPTIR